LIKKKICILTSGHPPLDERIFWKFGQSLIESGFSVSIICSTEEIDKTFNDINIKGFNGHSFNKRKKIDVFFDLLIKANPDLIICSEMLPVFAALQFRKHKEYIKIILDITEWFPENVAFKFKKIKRWFKYLELIIPYIYILNKVDHLILGEITKKDRYNFLAKSKPKSIIGYYPLIKYFNYKQPNLSKEQIVLGYAGVITFERGIEKLLQVSNTIAYKFPNRKFKLLLFGRFTYINEKIVFKQKISQINNVEVEFVDWVDYNKMSEVIKKFDICFDLRERNFIYKNSLPIKLFEYMACGKPFIFSNIKPIKDELGVVDCGVLVDPTDQVEIVTAIEKYLNDKNLYQQHSQRARQIIEQGRNWETESNKLISLVNSLIK